MASYCHEKFENVGTGKEVLVCWRQDKHVHDAGFITTLKRWLADAYPETAWEVRANSYRSNQSNCPAGSEEYV
jgi:hypothetical protein